MSDRPYDPEWYDIDREVYDWSIRIFRASRKFLKAAIRLHAEDQIDRGSIFVFNHFSRFETFIPQFLIFEATGAYCCAIASADFFREDDVLSRYLTRVGAFPHDHPRLFPLLAAQILRGRKVIIFPEGGMVKDRSVMDRSGHFSVYSRSTGKRRKLHTGAAVLAQGVELFKASIRAAYAERDMAKLVARQRELQLGSLDELLSNASKPTLIVPGNITFYPIRSSDNVLRQVVSYFAEGLSLRQVEELTIEGNILLRDTDMDVRLGRPIASVPVLTALQRRLASLMPHRFDNLDQVFEFFDSPQGVRERLFGFVFRKGAEALRDDYIAGIYRSTTINLSHLASVLISQCLVSGARRIGKQCFYNSLYFAIKLLQREHVISLHRSLLDPEDYGGLLQGNGSRLEHFIAMAKDAELLTEEGDEFVFSSKLCSDYDLDTVRMENLIAVYSNEAAPISEVQDIIERTRRECDRAGPRDRARWAFEDECLALGYSKTTYSSPAYTEINRQQTADADPKPFLFLPERPNGVGALLIHGLLASPAELRDYGRYLSQRGYTVLGVRLKGHGTSPHDLRQQTYEDWYSSVERNFAILGAYCERIVLIGFSTGGALALLYAAERPDVSAVVAVAVPIKFRNPAFMLVSWLETGNRLVDWGPMPRGLKAFIENQPEHPRVNYRHVPVKSLYELRRLIARLEDSLERIPQPVLLLHADEDPVVSPDGSRILLEGLTGGNKRLAWISASRHGILMENIGRTWEEIDGFLDAQLVKPAGEPVFRSDVGVALTGMGSR